MSLTENIKNKLNELSKDIIVTLPKNIKWSDYQKELDKVKNGEEVMNFKVNHLPNISKGSKCYIVHDGYIKGWMEITGLIKGGFKCTTTGKNWEGNFIQRSGPFNHIDPIPMKGFQGYRYYKN